MERERKAGGRPRGLRLNCWERVAVWVRERLGLNKQRPSPLKEIRVCKL